MELLGTVGICIFFVVIAPAFVLTMILSGILLCVYVYDCMYTVTNRRKVDMFFRWVRSRL